MTSIKSSLILSIIAYSLCSGSMVLVNKLTLHFFPFPSLVVTFQLFAAIAFISIANAAGVLEVDPIRWKFVVPYLAYIIAFSLGVYCNMRSLASSNVETVIVFRALAPVFVSLLDALFLGRTFPSLRSWGSLLTIVLGAYGYALTDEKFQTQGMNAYVWPTAYLFVISFEMAYGKRILHNVDLKTRSGPVLYTNVLGWPPMIMFALMADEFSKLGEAFSTKEIFLHSPVAYFLLIFGCIVGTGIGYSSWWCRGQVSAASFTLVGVMNKCLTVLANMLIWDKHATPPGIACLFLCLIGGSFYRQAPLREIVTPQETSAADEEVKNDESEVLLATSDPEKGTTIKRHS